MTAEIDVIVATRDRPGRLSACLATLERQTFQDFRVVVVDDGSRAPVTSGISPGLDDRLLVLRNDSPAGPAAARNAGVAAAGSPLIVFLDDDVRAHPDLLGHHRAVFAGNAGRMVSIGALLPPEGVRLPPWEQWQADRLAREHRRLASGEAIPSWHHLYAGNVAVRRPDFDEAGGFDTAFARQEDVELGYRLDRLGCRFVFEPRAVAWHDAEHSLADWLRIPAASAHYDSLMDREHPDSGRLSVHEQLRERHWLLRVAGRALGRGAVSRAAERLAIATGRVLYRARADRLALPAFSLVWDLEYRRALAEASESTPPSAGRSRP